MRKHLTCLIAGIAMAQSAMASPQHLVEDVFNIYKPTDTSLIIYVPVEDDELMAWTLTDTTALEGFATCGLQALKDIVNGQLGTAGAMPAHGFSSIAQYLAFLKTEGIWDGLGDIPSPSGRFYGCPDNLKNATYGAFCVDSIQRDGVIEYDHCLPVRREVTELDATEVRGETAANEE